MAGSESVSLAHRMEYGLLCAVGWVVGVLPLRAALALGWGLAWVTHWVVRFRVREARARIREVLGPELTDRAIRRIAWRAWRNIAFTAVEILRIPRLRAEDATSFVIDVEAKTEALRAHLREGKGLVLAVPHCGSWDVAGVLLHLLGLPMFVIARRQKNPLTDAYLNRLRGVSGMETVLHDERVLRRVIRGLKDGKVLAILPDVRARTPALSLEFLGATANIGVGTALFARQAGVPIQPGIILREGWTRHRWIVFEPVHPDPSLPKQEDWERMTQRVLSEFEQAIRAHPEQYFWYNKRWVLEPLPEIL